MVSTPRSVLRQSWKFRAAALVSLAGYWLLYAASSGMFFYYRVDIAPLLKNSPVPNPYFFVHSRSFVDLYNSGMVWIPNGHLQVNLLFGPTIFSIFLSALFAPSMLLLLYGLSARGLTKKHGIVGLLAMIPAVFSGGCCSIPFGVLLLGTFVPSAALSTFVYAYPVLTNTFIAVLMLVSLVYSSRKISHLRCPPQGDPRT